MRQLLLLSCSALGYLASLLLRRSICARFSELILQLHFALHKRAILGRELCNLLLQVRHLSLGLNLRLLLLVQQLLHTLLQRNRFLRSALLSIRHVSLERLNQQSQLLHRRCHLLNCILLLCQMRLQRRNRGLRCTFGVGSRRLCLVELVLCVVQIARQCRYTGLELVGVRLERLVLLKQNFAIVVLLAQLLLQLRNVLVRLALFRRQTLALFGQLLIQLAELLLLRRRLFLEFLHSFFQLALERALVQKLLVESLCLLCRLLLGALMLRLCIRKTALQRPHFCLLHSIPLRELATVFALLF